MREFIGVLGLVLLLLLVLPHAAGQGGVVIYTIPGTISVNSSFVWVASLPGGIGEDLRVSWAVIGLVESGALGSFEKLAGNIWFCDFEGACGPNPFPMAGSFDANIYVTSESGVLTAPHSITLSDLKVDPHLYPSGNDIEVQVNVPGYTGSAVVRYSLYDANTLETVWIGGEAVQDRNIAYCNCPAGFYNTNMHLENGKYYLSFEAETTDDRSGGSLEYLAIGEELKPLSVSLDRGGYWSGEKVMISGTTTFTRAGMEVKRHGASLENITLPLFSRGEYSEFSYDYLPGQAGSYELFVFAGYGNDSASKTLGFTVSNLLDASIPDINIGESGIFSGNYSVKNLGNQTLNITVSPSSELRDYVTAGLDKGSLGPGEGATLTLDVHGILSSAQGRLVFRTGIADVEKTLRIIVQKPVTENPRIGIEPLIWSPEEGYLLGGASATFTITNQGTGTLKDFSYSVEGIASDVIEVTLPGGGVGMADNGYMEVSVDPAYKGRERGTLSVASNGGSQDILIDLQFFDDISGDIDDLEFEMQSTISELAGRGAEAPSTLEEIVSGLAGIEASLQNGYYASANRDFERAVDRWEGVKSMVALVPEGGADLTPVIVVAILAAAGGAFLVLKKRGGRAGKGERGEEPEEDLEEEFY